MKELIQLSKVITQGIVIEDVEKDANLTFSSIYQKAAIVIKDIVHRQLEVLEGRKKSTKEDPNIIAFEGRRGTGKTSAMLSLCNALNDYHAPVAKNDFLNLDLKYRDISFTVLEHIDASLLEQTDDVLELVIANMYTKLLEYTKYKIKEYDDIDSRELFQLFDEVYGIIINMKRMKQNKMDDEISPLRALTKLSSSQNLGIKIAQLVNKYLDFMDREGRSQSFLVVAIDDLDMYSKKNLHQREMHGTPFDVLENIHRYLMIPGVIVLITYNYEDLCLGCYSHFKDMYSNTIDITDAKIRDLTIQYLRKVIPIWSRIHMISLSKRDYDNVLNTHISFSYQEACKCLEQFSHILWSENIHDDMRIAEISLKKLAFLFQADLGLFYDALGSKFHFIEFSTLRELSQKYSFKMHIKQIKENNRKGNNYSIIDKDARNRILKELMDDIYFRYVVEKLSGKERDFFIQSLQVHIERRSKDIIEDIRKCGLEKYKEYSRYTRIDTTNNIYDNISEINYSGIKTEYFYSYGELLFYLYMASSNGWFSKKLISCILNSYTIMLTHIYQEMLAENEPQDYVCKKSDNLFENRNRFKAIIAGFIAGSWSNRMVPRVNLGGSDLDKTNARHYSTEHTIYEDGAKLESVGAVKVQAVNVKWKFNLSKSYNEEIMKEEFQTLELLCMLFSNVRFQKGKVGEEAVDKDWFYISFPESSLKDTLEEIADGLNSGIKEQKTDLCLYIEYTDACFDVMNFINAAFDYKKYFTQLHEDLLPAYECYLRALRYEDKSVTDLIKQFSLEHEFEYWFAKSKGFAMPLYSFDMMYNILKRVGLYNSKKASAIHLYSFPSYLHDSYVKIGDLLKAEDEFYFSDLGGKVQEYRFSDNYNLCPFVRNFIKKTKNVQMDNGNIQFANTKENIFVNRFIELIKMIGNTL